MKSKNSNLDHQNLRRKISDLKKKELKNGKKIKKSSFFTKDLINFLRSKAKESGLSNLDFFVYLDYFDLKLISWIIIQI